MKRLGRGTPSRNASTYTVPGKISVSFAVLEFCDSGSTDGEGDPVGRLLPKGFCACHYWVTRSDIRDRQQVPAAGRCGGAAALRSPHVHFRACLKCEHWQSCDVHSVLSTGPSCHLADSVSQEQRENAKSALGAEKPDSHPSSGLTFGFVAKKSKAVVTANAEPLLWATTGMGILD